MSAVKHVRFVAQTPWRRKETRSLPKAMEWLEQQVIDQGHLDDFEVTLTVDVTDGEPPGDTDWLERRLGRE